MVLHYEGKSYTINKTKLNEIFFMCYRIIMDRHYHKTTEQIYDLIWRTTIQTYLNYHLETYNEMIPGKYSFLEPVKCYIYTLLQALAS